MREKIYEIKEYLLSKKYIIISILIIVLIVSFITYYFINNNTNSSYINDLELVAKEDEKEELEKCVVDIKGYILNPNSYTVDCNYRVSDVIKKAGGLLDNSDTSVINLSKKIKDGMVIVIYSKEEVNNFVEVKKEESIKEEKCKSSSVVVNDACITKNERVDNDNNTSKVEENINKSVNTNNQEIDNTPKIISINTATKEELMTLKGIGESKALAIISYREEHGSFTNIEEIKNIKGIGEKMFEKIKDFITL